MAKKSVSKNYIYNLVYQILLMVIPLITTPYLSRVLGAENLGIYSYTLSIATYFVLFGSLGVALYGQREIAYVRDDKDKLSKTFFEILFFRFVSMAFSIFTFYLFFCLNGNYKVYYRILLLELVANSLDISWLFQGLEEFKKITGRNIVVKLISLVLIFTLVKTKNDLWLYVVIYVLSDVIGNLSLWPYLPKYVNKVKPKRLNLKKHLRPILALFIPQIAVNIYTVLDKTMIGLISGNMVAEGNYEQSQNIVKTALTVVTALGTVVSPRIANSMSNHDTEKINEYLSKSFRFVWFMGIPVMFGIMGIANTLVPWFLGSEFNDSVALIMLGSPLIMAIGLNNVTGLQYLVPVKKQKLFTLSVVIGALFNFTLNSILIPIYGANGAIIASVLAEFLILTIHILGIKKDIDIKMIYKGSLKYIVSGIIMFSVVYFIGIKMNPTMSTTFLQILVGIIIYTLLLIIAKDDFIIDIFKKMYNFIKLKK